MTCARRSSPSLRTDDERALRIATLVYMNMGRGADQRVAMALIKAAANDGLDAAAKVCTARLKDG